MKTLTICSLALFSLAACGGGAPAGGADDPTPATDQPSPSTDGPPTMVSCDKEPTAEAAAESDVEAFSVTGDAVAADTVREFGYGADIVVSQSEGGSRYVKIHAMNECGLWLSELYVGSEIGGDPDKRETTYRAIKPTEASTFEADVLGAKISVAAADGRFKVRLREAIQEYVGE